MPESVYTSGSLTTTSELGPFTKSLEVYGIKLAGLKEAGGNAEVGDEFIRKVAQTVKLLLDPNGVNVDPIKQQQAIENLKKINTLQRIGVEEMGSYSPSLSNDNFPGWDSTNDKHNTTDFIWQFNLPGDAIKTSNEQITEVLEHLLHTLVRFALPGAYPDQFTFIENRTAYQNFDEENNDFQWSGLLYEAAQEAIKTGVFDSTDYEHLGKNSFDYWKSVTVEYQYALTFAEWGFNPKYSGSMAPEWSDSHLTPESIKKDNPLGHHLYENYVSKVLTKPSSVKLESMFQINNQGFSGYQPDTSTTKEYSGAFNEYTFINQGNDKYGIKLDTSSTIDSLTGLSTLNFSDKSIDINKDVIGTFNQVTGKDDVTGRMFRLYNAAFARFPDADGLKYWIGKNASGENSNRVVAQSFLASAEFIERYGSDVSDETYVNNLYKNVLGRDADAEGLNYWVGNLSSGVETRYEALLGFAESAENKNLFTEMTGLG